MAKANSSKDRRLGKTFIVAFLVLVLLGFVVMIQNYLIALLLAGISAALLMPIQHRMTRTFKGRKQLAAGLVLILTILIIGIPMIGMMLLVANEAVKVGTMIAPWVSQQFQGDSTVISDFAEWFPFSEQLEPFQQMIMERLRSMGNALGNFIVNSIPNLTKGTISLSLNTFIFLYSLFFFLVHGQNSLDKFVNYIPLQKSDSELILQRGFTVIRASLKGILIIGLLQGILIAGAFWIIGIQGAAFWGAIVVILSAIPGIGAPLVWIPAVAFLIGSGDIGWAITLTLWGLLVVGLIDNILRPMVVGRDAKLPDLLILISILGGISMFGAAGILIGPVIAALVVTAMDIYKEMFSSELEKR